MSRVVVNEIEAKVGNDISFNDTVKIDTIKGKTTAGSVSIQGEGTATTNMQQGLCKAWSNLQGKSTASIVDSFNTSSMSDQGTGLYNTVFTNNMNNDDYCATGAAGEYVDNGGNRSLGLRARATTGINVRGFYDGNSAADLEDLNVATHGDLA
tara:strand:- start:93 stop:551 length:459 start_codon:yes stop_codon:yes gene_type:complete